MKNLTKQQIFVIISSALSMLIISIQLITMDTSSVDDFRLNKYQNSIDSISLIDSSIAKFENSVFFESRNINNFKVVETQKKEEKVEKVVEEVKTRWIKTKNIKLFEKDKISFSFYFNGRAKFNIDGKTQDVNQGDELAIGNIILKQVIVGSNKSTGNTRIGDIYNGKVLSVGERAVYVDTELEDKVVKFKQNSDPIFFARNLMTTTEDDNNSTNDDEDDSNSGRRPPRGGRP